MAYGDTIRTREDPPGILQFKETVERGGYSVYRVLLHDPAKKEELIARLLEFDALVEQNGDLIAFAVPRNADVDAAIDYILDGKRAGFWGTQDGYLFDAAGDQDTEPCT